MTISPFTVSMCVSWLFLRASPFLAAYIITNSIAYLSGEVPPNYYEGMMDDNCSNFFRLKRSVVVMGSQGYLPEGLFKRPWMDVSILMLDKC